MSIEEHFYNVNGIGRILIRFIAVDDAGNCAVLTRWWLLWTSTVSITSHWTLQGRVYVHQETDSHPLRQNGNTALSICCGKITVEEWSCCLAGHPIWQYLQLSYYTTGLLVIWLLRQSSERQS